MKGKPKSLLLALSVLLCTATLARAQQPQRATGAMVVTAHPLASKVGIETIKAGGNAVDAAVAVAFALAVVLPWAGNIGGGGFMIYMDNGGRVRSFDFRERAPHRATETMFLDSGGRIRDRANLEGGLSVGVPGTVAGLLRAHEELGILPLDSVLQPAIDLAQQGFQVSYTLYDYVSRFGERLKRDPAASKVFFKEGKHPYKPGELWRQPELAETLRLIKERGRRGFYEGRTAMLLVNTVRSHGGIITLSDLKEYKAIERAPVEGTYRGYRIYSVPLPSSGGVVLIEMLNILEGYDLKRMGYNSAVYMHVLTEAMRRAYRDRARYLGDPEFNASAPIERLISKAYAARVIKTIS